MNTVNQVEHALFCAVRSGAYKHAAELLKALRAGKTDIETSLKIYLTNAMDWS